MIGNIMVILVKDFKTYLAKISNINDSEPLMYVSTLEGSRVWKHIYK